MSSLTSANVANAIVKLVAADALPALIGNLIMGNLVNRDFEPILARAGDVYSVGPENTTVALKHVEAMFVVPDITRVLAVPDLLRLYMEPAVMAIAEKIETDLLNLYAQFTANSGVSAADALREAELCHAEVFLIDAKVPRSANRYLVVDRRTYTELRLCRGFSEYQSAGEAGLRVLVDGSVGRAGDFFVFRSPFVSRADGAVNNLAFAKDAIGMVMRRLPMPAPGKLGEYAEIGSFGLRVAMDYKPNTLAQQFTIDVLYGIGVLRKNHGVQVRSYQATSATRGNQRSWSA